MTAVRGVVYVQVWQGGGRDPASVGQVACRVAGSSGLPMPARTHQLAGRGEIGNVGKWAASGKDAVVTWSVGL